MMTTATGENLMRYYRTGANLTQSEFAAAMGMPFRSYQDIESGKSPVRPVHVAAARWALVELASRSDLKSGFLPLEIAQVVKEAAK
ncbi:helix-turn-helix domain-containing protein [Rhizobium ruizarguesonis]|uniref:helix-turn-helix domain-containing protein n=1 Tax=Rhizobium ruizarguesonis TaxID=2081791 RepID=UPI001030F146|nr:helix-turn-helix transcriptional regulator [Rhizobium ruizarguesonis]TBF08706.1 XRE family transcriptional regulator [Rhizobium ruizarguesonis]